MQWMFTLSQGVKPYGSSELPLEESWLNRFQREQALDAINGLSDSKTGPSDEFIGRLLFQRNDSHFRLVSLELLDIPIELAGVSSWAELAAIGAPDNSATSRQDNRRIKTVSASDSEGGAKMERDYVVLFQGEPPIEDEELNRLSDWELSILKRNHAMGLSLNKTFRRSRFYPFPRDLSFSGEKHIFRKWARGRKNLVEIGVFEGASALLFRKIMARNATLHLIDPFVVIPDSDLTAREWAAKLNLSLSWNGCVKWYKDYSGNVVQQWRWPIDFLFIDGDHSEKACRSDWENWHSFVVVGGVVMFHDARFGKGSGEYWDGWPGPSKVVDQLFRGVNKLKDWEIVDEKGSVVAVRRIR